MSRDVVFDETVFPFASLHPNAGQRLRDEILLLPQNSISTLSNIGDAQIDDHMPLPIILVVANHDQVPIPAPIDADAVSTSEPTEKKIE